VIDFTINGRGEKSWTGITAQSLPRIGDEIEAADDDFCGKVARIIHTIDEGQIVLTTVCTDKSHAGE